MSYEKNRQAYIACDALLAARSSLLKRGVRVNESAYLVEMVPRIIDDAYMALDLYGFSGVADAINTSAEGFFRSLSHAELLEKLIHGE